MIWLLTIVVIGALLYRCGGLGKEDWQKRWRWVPQWMIHPKARDVGCSLLTLGWLLLFFRHGPWWTYLLSTILSIGAYSTYWDEVPFNHGKDNFYMHGLFIGLSTFPIIIFTGGWMAFSIRAVVLALAMGIWSKVWLNDDAEELGRGAAAQLTLALMRIGMASV